MYDLKITANDGVGSGTILSYYISVVENAPPLVITAIPSITYSIHSTKTQ
jgi:hypothetical protein